MQIVCLKWYNIWCIYISFRETTSTTNKKKYKYKLIKYPCISIVPSSEISKAVHKSITTYNLKNSLKDKRETMFFCVVSCAATDKNDGWVFMMHLSLLTIDQHGLKRDIQFNRYDYYYCCTVSILFSFFLNVPLLLFLLMSPGNRKTTVTNELDWCEKKKEPIRLSFLHYAVVMTCYKSFW